MATPCAATDSLSQAEAQCVLDKNPGLLAAFGSFGWSTAPDQYIAIICEWVNGIKPDEVKAYPTLDGYLRAKGCRGGSTPGPDPIKPGGGFQLNNQTLLLIGAGVLLGFLLKG